jgi:hypothetical protein
MNFELAQQLADRLQEWRQHHRRPTPIPADIWSATLDLAREHGISPVARALKLDYGAIKKRLHGSVPRSNSAGPLATFLEWPGDQIVGDCLMEIENRQGARLRLQITNAKVAAVVGILREFSA